MADNPRFEIKSAPYHPSSGDSYYILDHATDKHVPMHPYSDSKYGHEQLQALCAFLNELASPTPPDAD